MRMTSGILRTLGLGLLCALLLAPAAGAADQSSGRLRLRDVGTATRPTAIASPPGETRRVFVAEQNGRVAILADGRRIGTFLDLSAKVTTPGSYSEQGLLGLAFAPDYATSGRFYVFYTRKADNGLVVEEYRRSAADPNLADPNPARPILGPIPHAQNANHNGGQLAFGPDGRLYVGVGDGGGEGDPLKNGQNPATQLGTILRVDVSGATATPVGSGIAGAAPGVWDYGLRNPWRFSFDRQTGDLLIADVGQDRYEEIDVEPAGSTGGRNWGWNVCEGDHRYSPATGPAPGACGLYSRPALEYPHAETACSVVGGYVVRDPAFAGSAADFRGRYLYGDWCGGWLASFRWVNGQATDVRREPDLAVSQMTTFGEDGAARVYVASGRGTVYRIEPIGGTTAPGGLNGTSTKPKPKPAASGAAVRFSATLVLRRGRKSRWVLLGVACPRVDRTGCRGRVVLSYRRVRLGSAPFRLRPGKSARIRVRLSRKGLRALRRKRRVSVRITATIRDAAGRRRVGRASRTLRLR